MNGFIITESCLPQIGNMNYIEFLDVLGELWSSEASSGLNLHSLVIYGPLLSSLYLIKVVDYKMFRLKKVWSKIEVCLVRLYLGNHGC